MAARCRIELFGGLRVVQGDRTISRFRTQKTAALLAFLGYQANRSHPREALIEMLWPWASPAAGRHTLSCALSSLRHQLEPPGIPGGAVIVADRNQVQLNAQAVTTDVLEFEAALHAAERAADKVAKERDLEEAVRLYRGELLPGLYEPWIPAEQVRLSEEFVSAVVGLAKLLAERGAATLAISHLRRAIETEPLQEKPYQELMRRLAERGEHGAALTAYRDLERVLGEELGDRPSKATLMLAQETERLAGERPDAGGCTASPAVQPPSQWRRHGKLPAGTVTFLLIRANREVGSAVAYDHRSLRDELRRQGGVEIEVQGPVLAGAFGHAGDALRCAVICQRVAAGKATDSSEHLAQLTMAIHTAEVVTGPDGAYPGGLLQRAERLLDAGQPAQILCTEATAGLLRYDLNGGLDLRDLGVYRLRGARTSERVFQLDYPGGVDTSLPLNAESGYASHLPLQLTRFFGRQREIEQLRAMLTADARLVTMTGPPGCGKTRLAIEVATELQALMHGAVWFVPMADLRHDAEILDRAIEPLGIRRSREVTPLDQIAATVGDQASLLVFDNFEHLIARASEVHTLLQLLPRLRCLVTSRRRLGLIGEQEFPIAPLPTPEGTASLADLLRNESAALFVDRAQAVRPDFQLTAANAAAVVEICQHLEGIPLAIELAAARASVLGPSQILQRFKKGHNLVHSGRYIDERHRSLQAALEWSYELLTPVLQQFIARLSVFRGSWTADAAEAVCDEAMAQDHLSDLVDWSLIAVEKGLIPACEVETDSATRFKMLVIVREYARSKLKEMGAEAEQRTEERYQRWYAQYGTEEAMGALSVHGGVELQRALGQEIENLESACRGAVANGNAEAAFGAYRAAWQVLESRGRLSTAVALGEMVLTLQLPGEHRVQVLRYLWKAEHRTEKARAYLESALVIAREIRHRRLEGLVTLELGSADHSLGRVDKAREHLEAALQICREVGDRGSEATVISNLGYLHFEQGRASEAQAHYQTALAIRRELGDPRGQCMDLGNLGNLHQQQGRNLEARAHFETALAIAREMRDRRLETYGLGSLGLVCLAQDHVEEAQEHFEAALAIAREMENRRTEAEILGNLGSVYRVQGRVEEARSLCESALAIARPMHLRRLEAELLDSLAAIHQAQGRMGEAQSLYAAALTIHGEFHNRRGEGVTLGRLGMVHVGQGRTKEARTALMLGEAILREVDDPVELAKVLSTLAELEFITANTSAAQRAFDEAERLVAQLGTGPEPELSQMLTRLHRIMPPRSPAGGESEGP